MKKIIKGNNKQVFDSFVDNFLRPLDSSTTKNKQKILEICHDGKFIFLLDEDYVIHEVSEKPDFILKGKDNFVGLEHQTVVDKNSREREGFFQNIFQIAELELQKDSNLPNFLANCYLIPYINFKLNEKKKLINIVVNTVREYVLTGVLQENTIIESIYYMDHSQITVSVNLGAWWQKDITQEIIQKAIDKKDKLVLNYKSEFTSEQWLLLVIGSTGESSYRIDRLKSLNIESKFDRVYVMEDAYSNLYQIKYTKQPECIDCKPSYFLLKC